MLSNFITISRLQGSRKRKSRSYRILQTHYSDNLYFKMTAWDFNEPMLFQKNVLKVKNLENKIFT